MKKLKYYKEGDIIKYYCSDGFHTHTRKIMAIIGDKHFISQAAIHDVVELIMTEEEIKTRFNPIDERI